jgi:hypothetical protein
LGVRGRSPVGRGVEGASPSEKKKRKIKSGVEGVSPSEKKKEKKKGG